MQGATQVQQWCPEICELRNFIAEFRVPMRPAVAARLVWLECALAIEAFVAVPV